MDNRDEVRDYLTSRRERLTPDQAGIPFYGGRRDLSGVSESVLEALARALQLDEPERAHLLDLAATANASGAAVGRRRRTSGRAGVREGVQRILDTINAPAYVLNGRADIVAANRLGRALFADVYGDGAVGFNLARFLFLDDRSRDFYLEWETVARDCVAVLRVEAGRNP